MFQVILDNVSVTATKSPAESQPTNAGILVVDDAKVNRMLPKHYLTDAAFSAEEAENGEEALASVQRQPPDLILLDMKMPGMDGTELTRRLKDDPAITPAFRINVNFAGE